MIKRFCTWWREAWCDHFWRPAVTSQGGAMHCDYCHRTVLLSDAEFYARFGRMPQIGAA